LTTNKSLFNRGYGVGSSTVTRDRTLEELKPPRGFVPGF